MRIVRAGIGVVAFGILLFSSACNSQEEASGSTAPTDVEASPEAPEDAEYLTGSVVTTLESEGCAVLVQLDEPIENGVGFLMPVGLSSEYVQHGTRIKFTWRSSRAPSGNCYMGKPAILSNIDLL